MRKHVRNRQIPRKTEMPEIDSRRNIKSQQTHKSRCRITKKKKKNPTNKSPGSEGFTGKFY